MNREIYKKQNFGNQIGYGVNPALLIVDFTNSFADPTILGGGNINDAIQNTKILLDLFRSKQLPIFFTKVILDPEADKNLLFAQKAPALLEQTIDSKHSEIVKELTPADNEIVIQKKQASAFFNTNLQKLINDLSIDTLIITGCTTSGCVRASVVDCISYNIRPIVIQDCVGDRSLESHELSLFEMNSKYGDVINADDAVQYITSINK
jgi:maleamate amidohydrolase